MVRDPVSASCREVRDYAVTRLFRGIACAGPSARADSN